MPRTLANGLGERIRQRRRDLGLKQAVVARRAGISPSYLCELETKEGVAVSAVVLQQLAQVLSTTAARLLDAPNVTADVSQAVMPLSLQRARARFRLADDEVALLASIEYRGRRPQTDDDWLFLLLAIRRAVG